MNKTNPQHLFIWLVISLLNGCAYPGSSNQQNSHKTKKSPLARVPVRTLPGGEGDNWRYLGTSADSLLALEINESSITTTNNNISFQDRKTVVDPNKFNYSGFNPSALSPSGLNQNYKYSVSWWQLKCSQKQYTITSSSMYDAYGKLIKNYALNTSSWSNINNGSIAELQYNYLCHGTNRNLGY